MSDRKNRKARLDSEGTAKPLTKIVHHPVAGHCIGPGTPLRNPELVDEDGTRTPLAADRTAGVAVAAALADTASVAGVHAYSEPPTEAELDAHTENYPGWYMSLFNLGIPRLRVLVESLSAFQNAEYRKKFYEVVGEKALIDRYRWLLDQREQSRCEKVRVQLEVFDPLLTTQDWEFARRVVFRVKESNKDVEVFVSNDPDGKLSVFPTPSNHFLKSHRDKNLSGVRAAFLETLQPVLPFVKGLEVGWKEGVYSVSPSGRAFPYWHQ